MKIQRNDSARKRNFTLFIVINMTSDNFLIEIFSKLRTLNVTKTFNRWNFIRKSFDYGNY